MKKKGFFIAASLFLLLAFLTVVYLFKAGYLYVSKGPRLESISKRESKFRGRFESDYIADKSTISLCDSVYNIGDSWSEKFREDIDFYNLFIETDVNFLLEKIEYNIFDDKKEEIGSTGGYKLLKKGYSLFSRPDNLLNKFVVIFSKEGNQKCRDSIILTKQVPVN